MESKEKILTKHNLTVDLVHNKIMTERVYKALDEHARNCMIEIMYWAIPVIKREDMVEIVDSFLQSDHFKELTK